MCVSVHARDGKDTHTLFSLSVLVRNVSRTPGGLAGTRLIAASQLAPSVRQPGSERREKRERQKLEDRRGRMT